MKRTVFAAGVLTSVVLVGSSAVPAAAQSRVVVPSKALRKLCWSWGNNQFAVSESDRFLVSSRVG